MAKPLFQDGSEVKELPLDERLKGSLTKMGIERLTVIQAASLPAMMKEGDVLIKSETGSGKTMAYAIPVVQLLVNDYAEKKFARTDGCRNIILAPTRELAVQCHSVLENLTRPFPSLVSGCIMGGENRQKEKARLRKGVVILIATPGRMTDHLKATSSFSLKNLKYIVYDEADRLLDMGFEKDISGLLAALKNANVTLGKSVLASATLDRRVQRLAHVALNKPTLVGFREQQAPVPVPKITTGNVVQSLEQPSEPTVEELKTVEVAPEPNSGGEMLTSSVAADTEINIPSTLKQYYIVCPAKWRLATLAGVLRWKLDNPTPAKIIVFLSSCDSVELMYTLFSRTKIPRPEGMAPTPEEKEKAEAAKAKRFAAKKARQKAKKAGDEKMRRQMEGEEVSEDEMDEDFGVVDFDSLDKKEEEDELAAVNLFPYNLFKLHGNVSQIDRKSIFLSFGKSERGVLFCTDVAARGLDLPNVNWIIQYDTPGEERNYIHRIGRTARIGRAGNAILFLMPHELAYLKHLRNYKIYLEEIKSQMVTFHTARVMGADDVASAAPKLQFALQKKVLNDNEIRRLAKLGYQAFVRAYTTHPKRLKKVFTPQSLHLGHIAQSFGLSDKPSKMETKEFHKDKQKERDEVTKNAKTIVKGNRAETKKEYVPALMKKASKIQLDIDQAKKATQKRPLNLSKVSEFEDSLADVPRNFKPAKRQKFSK